MDDELMDDFEAAHRVGEKVLEMADRLSTAQKIVPGSRAAWAFDVDGVRFELEMKIGGSAEGPKS
ncbi:hypothetical protein ACPVPU_07325 [Sphingomonas sp. CJ99]